MAKLFGTDGVRGIVNKELTPELAYRLGEAAGHFLVGNKKGKIVIGRDTRKSGKMLEDSVVSGLIASGVDVYTCGIVPTPAVAFLLKELGADGGVVISASHNPPEYNGIKLFSGDGYKLPDELESNIEKLCLDNTIKLERPIGSEIGTVTKVDDATERYIKHCLTTSENKLTGMRVAIDCGHGASYITSVETFKELGAEIFVVNDDFTGMDINVNCGSTNLSVISELVKTTKSDFGIAHDGDADRVLAVDENGDEIDGDIIMAICALDLKKRGRLANDTVVSTVMCNLGLNKMMKEYDIRLLQAAVGDRYVLEQMRATGAVFGGEQSGHIIFLENNTTGDGLVTAIQLANSIKNSGEKLSSLKNVMKKYPQILINVPVKDKSGLDTNDKISAAIKTAEVNLKGNGRVLVRPSGTENLIRVMAEAETKEVAEATVNEIVEVVKAELA